MPGAARRAARTPTHQTPTRTWLALPDATRDRGVSNAHRRRAAPVGDSVRERVLAVLRVVETRRSADWVACTLFPRSMLSSSRPMVAGAAAVGAAAICTYTQCKAGAPATATGPEAPTAPPRMTVNSAAFNCSPAPRIAAGPVVWAAERPGRDTKRPCERDIDLWVDHMQRRGVARVLCLLGEKHLELYSHLDGGLCQAIEQRGLQWVSVPFIRERPLYLHLIAAARQLRAAERAGESTVVHCSAGCGRSAAVLVAWMCGRYGTDFDEAVGRLAKEAELEGVRRQPMEVGEEELREACAELILNWGALGLAAGADEGFATVAQSELDAATDADQPLHTFDC